MKQDFSSLLMFISLNIFMSQIMSPIEQIVFMPVELEIGHSGWLLMGPEKGIRRFPRKHCDP